MLEKGEISIRDTNLRKNVNKKEKKVIMNDVMKRKLSLTQKHYHIEPFPSTPPPRIHSRKLPKQKSHVEAQFDDEEKDVGEAKDRNKSELRDERRIYHKSGVVSITRATSYLSQERRHIYHKGSDFLSQELRLFITRAPTFYHKTRQFFHVGNLKQTRK